jgi:hypothetical protein
MKEVSIQMLTRLNKPVILLAAVAMVGVGLSPSSAAMSSRYDAVTGTAAGTPWSPWKKLPKPPPGTHDSCGTKVVIVPVVWRGEYRTRKDADGNDQEQTRGAVHLKFNPGRGHTIVVDVGGPTKYTFYKSGDLYYQARGLHLFTLGVRVYRNSTPTRIPRLFFSAGSFAVFIDSNGTSRQGDDEVTFLNRPTRHWGVCSILKSGVVPKPLRV